MDEIKPCPFCGTIPKVQNGMLVHPEAMARDGACVLAGWGISIIHSKWGTKQVTAWNTRHNEEKYHGS